MIDDINENFFAFNIETSNIWYDRLGHASLEELKDWWIFT